MTLESKSTCPLPVAKVTTALSTPAVCVSVRSIRWTHDEHVMPDICRGERGREGGGEREGEREGEGGRGRGGKSE